MQHNFRTHFTKWPDPSTGRDSAVVNSIIALSGLTNDQANNLIIKIMLAELKFIQKKYQESIAIDKQVIHQYPESKYLIMLNKLHEGKIDQSRSPISANNGQPVVNPFIRPYQNFSIRTFMEALIINYIIGNKVLVALENQAKTENKIHLLNSITINIVLTLMQCSYSDKVIETLGIQGLLRFGENLYQFNSIPSSNYISEFSIVPFPSFLYLICHHGLENLKEFINFANQFYSTVPNKDGYYFSKSSLLSHKPFSLKRAGFLRLPKHFSTYEVTKLSQYELPPNQNQLKYLCDADDATFKLLINRLMEFKNFYVTNLKVNSFDIAQTLLLYFEGKLVYLQKPTALPLIQKFGLEMLTRFNSDFLAMLCSVNLSKTIECVGFNDLLGIGVNHFDLFYKLCNFENRNLIKDKWLTVTQFLSLSEDRKKLLNKLLPIIGKWTKEQFRLILNIGRTRNNPFNADKIKLLITILNYIPTDFSFKSMEKLIKSDDLLKNLAEKFDKLNNNIAVLLNQLSESTATSTLEKHELELAPACKNPQPSFWQKPPQESPQNKAQDKTEQEDSNPNPPNPKRFKKEEPEPEITASNMDLS